MEAGWLQVAAVVVAVVTLFYVARRDARDARVELQKSIEGAVAPVRADIVRLEGKLDQVSSEVRQLGRDVAQLRGRQEERDKLPPPSTDGFGSGPSAQGSTH